MFAAGTPCQTSSASSKASPGQLHARIFRLSPIQLLLVVAALVTGSALVTSWFIIFNQVKSRWHPQHLYLLLLPSNAIMRSYGCWSFLF